MEELFGQANHERADISLCIFPHLREFMAVDLRNDDTRVTLLSTSEVFGSNFIAGVEEGFSQILRESTEHPFAHLIDLPLRVEELIREAGMQSILDQLGGGGDEDFPTVAVFIIGGATLSMTSDQITEAFQAMLGDKADSATISECSKLLDRLVVEERQVVKTIDRQELRDALEGQSPNFFTLWERRN